MHLRLRRTPEQREASLAYLMVLPTFTIVVGLVIYEEPGGALWPPAGVFVFHSGARCRPLIESDEGMKSWHPSRNGAIGWKTRNGKSQFGLSFTT